MTVACNVTNTEQPCWDSKDGELCLSRAEVWCSFEAVLMYKSIVRENEEIQPSVRVNGGSNYMYVDSFKVAKLRGKDWL